MVEKLYFRVSGRVQGVCFRACTDNSARECGVTGWVRNRIDGDVEGEAYGEKETLERFVNWLYQGSPGSRVDDVLVEQAGSVEKAPERFEIRF